MADEGNVASRSEVESLLRQLAPQVLGALYRRYGKFEACEDAVQEALLEAALRWTDQKLPDNPRGWLRTVATRRLADQWRSDQARRNREVIVAVMGRADEAVSASVDDLPYQHDDTLMLLFMCCHPALSAPSQIALTLRAVGGLTTSQIAAAFMVPESTMVQRISRAKQRIRSTGTRFRMPPPAERRERLRVVLHVLYLIFNEGYTATSGPDLQRGELTREAIRLTREVHRLLPDDGEVAGLLALMLLTDARRDARSRPDGTLVPIAEQDRRLWHRESIREGIALVTRSLSDGPVESYQIQAAIAALHAEAATVDDTDWPQIAALYELLEQLDPNPMVTLNRAVATAMAKGPEVGLRLLDGLDDRIANHRLDAVRAHLLEMAGDRSGARVCYLRAAQRTTSLPERRYLESRAARLSGPR
ncbi:sigma-70 family RNA polymerase sigma factor [Micromonospora sp. NBC_00821]|uniref:RNA polymerase sigma factor n=1 Tax=Micromonospora sp. NBC_00821 TaxID=2975977 RepID=UPI002ED025BA|nr:sigma-70 family RNA polymerase sigma factor [Micromonospora sp. NBC_00821]